MKNTNPLYRCSAFDMNSFLCRLELEQNCKEISAVHKSHGCPSVASGSVSLILQWFLVLCW